MEILNNSCRWKLLTTNEADDEYGGWGRTENEGGGMENKSFIK